MYSKVNEWQISGIHVALTEADSSDADFIDHDEVLARWEKKMQIRWLQFLDLDEG